MSFDLIVWSGSPANPSSYWSEIQERDERTPFPSVRLVEALREAFGGDVVRVGGELRGRGWELGIEDAFATIVCASSVANDAEAIAPFVRAAHAAGCSIYDPQFGAYWPALLGLPEGAADAWRFACFDQGFVYDDDEDEGHVPEAAVRLCPDDAWPLDRKVWIYQHVALPSRTFERLLAERARLYRERFPGWAITVWLGGPGACELDAGAVAAWLRGTDAKPLITERARPSIAFVVLGNFDGGAVVDCLETSAFELVPFADPDKLLASVFDEQVVSLAVIVPTRLATDAPEALRAGLRELEEAIASVSGGAPAHFADPSQSADADVGANLAWVEALVGLAPSEPVRTIAASDVPRVVIDTEDDDEDEDDASPPARA